MPKRPRSQNEEPLERRLWQAADIRGSDSSNVNWNDEGSCLNDLHPDLKADLVTNNLPFNGSDGPAS